MTLPPVPAVDSLVSTLVGWHRLAEHVLAPVRWRVEGRIGLRVVPGGFGTPRLSDGRQVQVLGRELLVDDGRHATRHPLTTVAAAARVVGIEPGAPAEVFPPTTPLDPDARLDLDRDACDALAAWFGLGDTALQRLRVEADADDAPSDITLWPEHFDVALERGNTTRHTRGTFGASPGDGDHVLPYLYVTHWESVPVDPFWNDSAFRGASLSYPEVASSDDPMEVAMDFFCRGRALLTGSAS